MSTTQFDGANADLFIATGARTEIVFIEDNVGDIQSLVQQVGNNREVVILDSTRDGLQQIAQALEGRTGIDALHIISHGAAGSANLGALSLDSGSVGTHQAELATIGASLSAGGDILLYGCDVGSGAGQQFVNQLAIATGADVAASNNLTGSASLGGDWNLEVTSGQVATASLAPASFDHVLTSGTNVDFEGAFTKPNAQHVLYNVPINNGATFDISSASTYLVDGDGNGNHSVAVRAAGGMTAAISLTNGGSFALSSLQLGVDNDQVMGGLGDYAEVDVTIVATDANNQSINLGSFAVTADNFAHGIQYRTFSFNGLTNVKSLQLMFDGPNNVSWLYVDNMVIGSGQAAKPAAPANLSVDFNSDSGISHTDKLTNDATPTIHGTAQAGTTVHLYDDDANATDLGSITADANGNWTITANKALDDRSHNLSAKAIDGAGNASDASTQLNITIDTQAPEAPTPHLNPDSDTGRSNIDHITGDTTLTIEGSQQYDSDLIKLFDVIDGNPVELKQFHAIDGRWSITTNELSQGVHHLVTQATDAAGNVSAFSEQLDVTIVTDAPTAHALSATLENDGGASHSDFVTNVDTQSISGTLSAALLAGERVQVSTNGGLDWNNADVEGTHWTVATSLQYGEHELQVRVINAVDNIGPVFTQAYTLDQEAPSVRITTDHYQLRAGETATITFSFTEDPGASFSWDGEHGNISVSGGTLSAISGGNGIYTATFTPTPGLDVTTASISVAGGSYTDLAGNAGTEATLNGPLFDTLAPDAPSGLALADNSDNGVDPTDLLTSLANPTISGHAPDGTMIELYDSNGAAIGAADVIGGSWKITTTTSLENGEHHLFARAFDNVGNRSEVSTELKITVDRTAPAVSAPILDSDSDSGIDHNDGLTNVTTPVIRGTADAGSQVTLYEGNTALGSVTADQGGNWTIVPNPPLIDGPHTLTAKAVDAAGNVGTAQASLELRIDTTAPYGPMPNLDPASDTGIDHTDRITGDTTPTITGVSMRNDQVKLYDVVDGKLVEIGSTTAVDGRWSITTGELVEGTHHLVTKATDAAGNEGGVSDQLDVTILTGKPSAHAVSAAFNMDTGASPTDFITSFSGTQVLSGQLDAALAQGDYVQVSIDGGQHWIGASVDGTHWSLATALPGGDHELQVRVLNAVQNSGEVYKQAFTVDLWGPTLAITSNVDHLKAGETATITFTFSEDPGSSFGLNGGLQVVGGTLSALEGTGNVRTATFTPAAGVDGGVAGIRVSPDAYADLAGNAGSPAVLDGLRIDTQAPAAPAAPHLVTDNGRFENDHLTSIDKPTFSGFAEERSFVTLYDTDTGAKLGEASAVDGPWALTLQDALKEGVHHVAATVRDAAGNVSQQGESVAITVDTTAPTVAITSDVAKLKIGETATFTFTFSDDPGTGFSRESIIAGGSPGIFGELTGTGLTRTMSFKPNAGIEGGLIQVGVSNGSFTDAAGNVGKFTTSLPVAIDTLAPAAPSAPTLAAASDTGTAGDGHTQITNPVIEGTALANALVDLYDGERKIGSATADANGKWSIAASNLDIGSHMLSATQSDAAGNVSAASSSFALSIDQPPAPPVNLVDGVRVDSNPVFLGGVLGTKIDVPVVTSSRSETSGATGVADIPLATKGGGNVLLAQLPEGVGLSSSGANVGSANAIEFLISSIKAATPTHDAADQGHLTSNGSSFLAGLAASNNLLVQTVTPVSGKAGGALTLTGATDDATQDVALVIDAGKLAAGSTIQLQHVDFAAIIGTAHVIAASGNTMLSGDAAAQHFTVDTNGNHAVFAGGGSDTLSFGLTVAAPVESAPASGGAHASSVPASGTTVLHGGQDSDTATFTGARADYDIEQHNGYLVVSEKAAPAAQALVVNVEQLQFSDGSVTVENNADMNVLSGMYQSMFGRQADMKGIEFWADANQAGVSMGSIALHMVGSNEYLAGHDAMNGNAAHDVGLLYQALFNRDADADGLAFWTNQMSHGMSLEDVATNMVQSVEMVGHQRAAIDWDFIV